MNKSSLYYLTVLVSLFLFAPVKSQFISPNPKSFTHQDTLRGSITPERAWWDLKYYHLDITVNPADSTIYGTNTVTYKVLTPASLMQIDLQPPLNLTKAVQNGKSLNFKREGNVYWINLNDKQEQGKIFSVELTYGVNQKFPKDRLGRGELHGQKTQRASRLLRPHARVTGQVYGGLAKTTCTMNLIVC